MDERAIVLTDKYLYKLDPKKNFHIKKTGISIDDIIGLSVTSGREQLIVVHLISNHDLVFYMHTTNDRVGEFVGHVAKLKRRSYVFFFNRFKLYLLILLLDRIFQLTYNDMFQHNLININMLLI
jgi:hypothetical protein